jgi:hypothetical protein
MNNDLIYSIEQIFSTDPEEGVLGLNSSDSFYIAPYQRGYKWASETENDPVFILMKDLTEAWEGAHKEYYLQYITTKQNRYESIDVLEVIDGQQRLTTLSLIFSVLSNLLSDKEVNITKDKLRYQVRPRVTTFFNEFIYGDITLVLDLDWKRFIAERPEYNEQDIYYLFHAALRIRDQLLKLSSKEVDPISKFAEFLRKDVKIIVNNIKGNVSCEKIFSNLNTNKVELTESELIKGLLLTKAAREKNESNSYKELLELRSVLGRQWDDVTTWASRPEISSFYFEKSSFPIDKLLLLVAVKDGFSVPQKPQRHMLFNYFHSQIKRPEKRAISYFLEIIKVQKVLNDWYNNDTIFNCLGFLSMRSKKFNYSDHLENIEKPTSVVENSMRKQAANLIPDEIEKLDYSDSEDKIHHALQALSIFGEEKRFDFHSFSKERWSLEHIYPQNFEALPDILKSKDIQLINNLLGEKLDDIEKLKERLGKQFTMTRLNNIKKKLSKDSCKLELDEKQFIYVAMKTDKLNSLGNLALLTSSDNSSNSNGMFDRKRNNIVKRISTGSFVPKHTYDVFSKLLSDQMTPDLTAWTEKDMSAHQDWIINKLTDIKARHLS